MFNKMFIVITWMLFLFIQNMEAQFVITSHRTAEQLIERLVKENVTIINPQLDCENYSNALYSIDYGTYTIDYYSYLDTAGIALAVGNINVISTGAGWALPSVFDYSTRDEDVNNIYRSWGVDTLVNSGFTCKLSFDMIPHTDTIKINYTTKDDDSGVPFSSAFINFVRNGCRPACDMFAILVSGGSEDYSNQNFAIVPGTTNVPINIFTCKLLEADSFPNCRDGLMDGWEGVPYTEYYHNLTEEYDTTHPIHTLNTISSKMEAVIPVTPCDTYSVKLAVAKGTFYFEESDFSPGMAPEGIESHGPEFLAYSIILDIFFLSNLRGVGTVYECATGDTSTAIPKQQDYALLSIYPNPAATSIQVDVSKVSYSSGTILIYDMMGKEVYTETLIDKKDKLNISVKDLPPGVYTLMLQTDKGNYLSKFTKEK